MRRTIKSFVMRAGRVSNRQQYALDHWLPTFELSMGAVWDLPAIFGREAKTVVEIGFGMGASLLTMAKNYPELNFIGIEVHRAGLGSLCADLYEENITNVRLVAHDAVEVFKQQFQPETISCVQIFFPDPWHKKKHNKRRLIQTEFINLLIESLQLGGTIHCATDWQDYADHMYAVLSNTSQLQNSQLEGGFAPRPSSRPLTKFEQRGTSLGHGIWDLIYNKI